MSFSVPDSHMVSQVHIARAEHCFQNPSPRPCTSFSVFAPVGQDFADAYVQFFQSDELAEILHMGAFVSGFLGSFFSNLLEDWDSHLFSKLQSLDVAAPLVEMLERLQRVARAVCLLVNVNPQAVSLPKPADLQYIANYTGRESLERQWKTWLTTDSANKWWADESMSVLKVSGQSLILEPKVKELKSILEKGGLAAHEYGDIVQLYKVVAKGTREIVHKPLGEALLDQLKETANAILDVKTQGINTVGVDGVLSGLTVFSAQPGILSLAQKVREAATAKVADIAAVDLGELMSKAVEAEGKSGLDDIPHILALVKKCKCVPADLGEVPEKFLRLIMQTMTQKVC